MGCNLQIKLGAGGDDWTALQVIKPVQLILCTLHQSGQSSRLNITELLSIRTSNKLILMILIKTMSLYSFMWQQRWNEVTLSAPQVARRCLRTHHPPPPAPRGLQQALMATATSWWTLTPTQQTWRYPACRDRRRLTRGGTASPRRSWNLSRWSRRPARCWFRMSRRYYISHNSTDQWLTSHGILDYT